LQPSPGHTRPVEVIPSKTLSASAMFAFRSLEEFDDDHGTVKLLDGKFRSSVWLTR
jgi:hypothetical protein